MELRRARLGEENKIMNIINDGKMYQRSFGFIQWQDHYPSLDSTIDDINNQIGFVLCDNNIIVGYCALIIGVEQAYNDIKGKWLSNYDYVTIHRIAIDKDYRGKGLASVFFGKIKEYARINNIKSVRVDTHEQNIVMQKVLERDNFRLCGTVFYEGHGLRLAYEWVDNN